MHMAVGAVMNAVWDLRAKREGNPLWLALARLTPAEVVALVDWTYLSDFLDPGQAREILEQRHPERDDRIARLSRHGLAAYTTSPGWLGYGDDKLDRLQLLQLQGAQILQIDATRVGGVHDLVAMILLAAHAGVDVIPHAGGVGLCEAVQHFAFFNAVSVAASPERLVLEYVDHLHEHMAQPVEVAAGRYWLPTEPGAGTAFGAGTSADFAYPAGSQWQDPRPR